MCIFRAGFFLTHFKKHCLIVVHWGLAGGWFPSMDLFEVTPSSGFRKGIPPRNYSNLIRWLPQNFHRNTREPAICCKTIRMLPQEIVTRWTSKTRIEYRPHAKAPGSKSHIRLVASWSRWFYLGFSSECFPGWVGSWFQFEKKNGVQKAGWRFRSERKVERWHFFEVWKASFRYWQGWNMKNVWSQEIFKSLCCFFLGGSRRGSLCHHFSGVNSLVYDLWIAEEETVRSVQFGKIFGGTDTKIELFPFSLVAVSDTVQCWLVCGRASR